MKLPQLSGYDAIKKLRRAGFLPVRQRGSHVQLEKQLPDTTIIKEAGLSVDEFSRL